MKTKTLNRGLEFIALTVLMFASVHSVRAQTGAWTTITPPMPTAVIAGSGVAFGGKFYVMDGANGSFTPSQVYNPVTNGWSVTAADPVPRAQVAAGVISNKIYVAEGWINSDANNATTALRIYDPATDSWTAGPSSLVARGESATAVLGGKLYITGGNADFYSGEIATLEIYDPNTSTWSTGTPIPVAPEAAVGAAINGKFYVVGGALRPPGGGADPATANVFIYNPATAIWTSGTPMPSPRYGAAGGVINGKLYITGGRSANGTNNPVVVYDPILNSWSVAAAEPTPRSLAIGAAVNGKLFVAGGYQESPAIIASTAEAFTPVPVLTNIVLTPINPTIVISSNQQFTATGSFNDGSSRALTSGGNAWTNGTAIPTASYGLGGAFVGGKFYAISGFATTRVAVYDVTNNSWSTAASLPQLLQYFGTAVLDGKIYVVGGDTGGSGDRDTLLRYDPGLNTWTTLAPMPLGARSSLGAAALNGKIYAVGGNSQASSSYLNRVEEYDPASNTWTTKASMPTAHSSALVGVIYGKLYVAGGWDAAGVVTNGAAFDPDANFWSSIAPLPFTNGSGEGVVLNGKLFSIGAGPSPEQRVFAYDPASDSWSTNFAPMPTGRHVPGVAADEGNNKIYAVGGWNGNYASALEIFTPPGEVVWSSSTSGVASINADGLATGLSVGGSTITASAGNLAANTTLTVVTQPAITNQPLSVTVSAGGTATFTAGASGGALSYQWQLNGTNIVGATGASLVITNVSLANIGVYTVIVNNAAGSVTSRSVMLTSVDIHMLAGVYVNGPIGSNYLIQATSDLPGDWTTLTNIALPSQPYIYVDYSSVTNKQQFYRAVPQ